jgi:type VI protein secretion system component Hcp
LNDLDLNGTLDIVSAGRTDVTLESSRVARGGHVKWEPILSEMDGSGGGGGRLAIVGSRFDGGLTVESTGDPIDAEITRTRVQGGVLKFHSMGEAAASRLALVDSRLDGGLDVSVEGEGPEVQMDGLAVSGGEPGRVHLVKRIDKSSPILAQLLVQDSSFDHGLDVLVLALHPADKSTPILMRQSSFGEGLSVESDQPLDLTLDTVRSAFVDVFLKLGDVTGEASDRDSGGSILIEGSRLDGLDITVEGDLTPELSIEDTTVRKRPGRVKYGDITLKRGVIDKSTPMLMKRSSFDGGLEIESDRPLDVTLDDVLAASVDLFLKVGDLKGESPGGGGSILVVGSRLDGLDVTVDGEVSPDLTIEDTHVRKRPGRVKYGDITLKRGVIDKSTPLLMKRSSFEGGLEVESDRPLDLTLEDVRSAGLDVFIKLPDVEGEEIAAGDGSIRVLNSRLGGLDVTVEGDASPELTIEDTHVRKRPGRVKYGDITLKRGIIDKATPVLMTRSTFGEGLSVESDRPLDLTLDTVRSAAVDVFIKLPDVPDEETADGSVRVLSSRLDGLDITVEGDRTPELTIEDTHVRKRPGKVKYESITIKQSAANKATPLLMLYSRSSFEGGLEVEADRPLDLTAEDVRSASIGLFLKLPDVPGETRGGGGGGGRIAILSSRVDGDLTVESNAPLDLSMQSSRAGGVYLKLDGIKGEALSDGTPATGGSHVVLWDSAVDGGLHVAAGAGNDELHLDRVRVRGQTQIDLGGGDDRLRIVDSFFHEFARLDGGDGHDLLALDNARFLGGFELLDWEEITGSPKSPRRGGRF